MNAPLDQYEEFERLKQQYGKFFSPKWIGGAALVIFALLGLLTAAYTVAPEGEAIVKRFGRVVRTAGPGLHLKWPFGIETARFVPIRRVLKEEFGFRTVRSAQRTEYAKGATYQHESLMLTGDLNVIDVEWVVQYRIVDPDKWLHQARDPRASIRDVSEAVMRRVVGNRLGSAALTEARPEIAAEVRQEMQNILENEDPDAKDYDIGIHLGSVEMQDVTPPDRVKPAFNEVNKARQERERLINEAEKRRNQVIPRARGEAEQTVSEAEAYRAERVNGAKGEAARFTAILEEYQKAPAVTRRRLLLEMADEVLPKVGRIYVLDAEGGQPLPVLDLEGTIGRSGSKTNER